MDKSSEIQPITPFLMAAAVEQRRRREVATIAVGAIADILDVEVRVDRLIAAADEVEPSEARLVARRAVRGLMELGDPETGLASKIGQVGVYHYMEGVVIYGASRYTYTGLMEKLGLSAEQTTALYALRAAIAEESNDQQIGFPTILKNLASIGISPQEAADDTDAALEALDMAGFFVDHLGGKAYDRPRFLKRPITDADLPPLKHHVDSYYDTEILLAAAETAERLNRIED